MAVLTIQWESAQHIAPNNAEVTPSDDSTATPVAARPEAKERLDRPMWVYVVADGDADAMAKIDKIALDPDKVRIGSKFFRCVKVSPELAAKDKLLADTGDDAPRMVFIDVDYDVVEVIDGKKVSGSKIWSAMQKCAKKSYKGNLDRNVGALRKVLNEFDKIAKERQILSDKEQRGVNDSEAKKIAKEKEDLDARQKKAEGEQKDLFQMEVEAA